MARVSRADRCPVNPVTFREAMKAVFGEKPNFRRAAKSLRVPKSTLDRVWRGATEISTQNYGRIAKGFGVHPSWLSPISHHPPSILAGRDGMLMTGHVFPGTPHNEVQQTPLGNKALYWLARTYASIERLGVPGSDRWVSKSPVASWFGNRKPPAPVMHGIDEALANVEKEWGVRLGELSLQRRHQILAVWHQAWAVTLEAASSLVSHQPVDGKGTAKRN
jgi:hypothetical protein